MDQMADSQDRVRRFNEDETVWQHYEYRRRLRLTLGAELLIPDEILDELDWFAAERECPPAWCVGRTIEST